MLTLGQAAKETGVSKTAIARAIKSGRMSANKNDLGEYQIDPAELFRVYPVTPSVDSGAEHHATPKDYSGLHAQLEAVREVLRQIEGERDDLRRRLDEEAAERRQSAGEIRRLTLLLTDQRQPTAVPQAEPEPSPPAVRHFLWLALAAAAMVGTWWYVWPWFGGRQ